MKENYDADYEMPSIDDLEEELVRERHRRNHSKVLRTIILILVALIIAVVLVTVLVLPVLQITGSSMARTLNNGDIVVALKTNNFHTGDIIAYEYNRSTQIKRLIALAGDTVNIDDSGNVFVNGTLLDEPYVYDMALGECDIEFPFTVPPGENFVMGDHRSTSVDSRSTAMGCIKDEDISSKILFRVWPVTEIGRVQ